MHFDHHDSDVDRSRNAGGVSSGEDVPKMARTVHQTITRDKYPEVKLQDTPAYGQFEARGKPIVNIYSKGIDKN